MDETVARPSIRGQFTRTRELQTLNYSLQTQTNKMSIQNSTFSYVHRLKMKGIENGVFK